MSDDDWEKSKLEALWRLYTSAPYANPTLINFGESMTDNKPKQTRIEEFLRRGVEAASKAPPDVFFATAETADKLGIIYEKDKQRNKMTIKKKRSPTDSTMRNVRAANKRIKALEKQVLFLEEFLVEQCPETWKDFLAQKQAKK